VAEWKGREGRKKEETTGGREEEMITGKVKVGENAVKGKRMA